MSSGGRPHFPPIRPYSSSPSPQRETGLVKPEPGSVDLSDLEKPFAGPLKAYDSRKWYSPEDYIKVGNAVHAPLVPRASKRATAMSSVNSATNKSTDNDAAHIYSGSEAGDSRSSSDLESEAGEVSLVLRSSTPTLDAAVYNGRSLADPSSDSPLRPRSFIDTHGVRAVSALDELRAITTEMEKLLVRSRDVEYRFRRLLEISHKLGRIEALKEASDVIDDVFRDAYEIHLGKI